MKIRIALMKIQNQCIVATREEINYKAKRLTQNKALTLESYKDYGRSLSKDAEHTY